MSLDIIVQIGDGLIPAVYSAGDSVSSYYRSQSVEISFYVNIFKFCFILICIAYVGYLYFYKGERERASDNLIDLIIFFIAGILTCFAIYFSYHNMITDKTNKLKNKDVNMINF